MRLDGDMRVLTQKEKAVFEAAFTSIMRVASVEADIVMDIVAVGQKLPQAYVDLMFELGGMATMQNLFCPLYKEKAMGWLIEYCFRLRLQPRAFEFRGMLAINRRPIPAEEHTYMQHSQET